jgi:hypothetical protein
MKSHLKIMKMTLVICTVLLAVALTSCATSEEDSCGENIPTYQLLAYYPFNGGSSDESGNGHHGTVTGAVLTDDRFGNSFAAYLFDGGDWIEIPDDPAFTFTSEPFTLSIWARMTQFSAEVYYILGHSEGPGDITDKWIFCQGSDNIQFIIGSGGGWYPLGNYPFQLGVWYHLVIRRDGTNFAAYVNGTEIGSNVITTTMKDPNTSLTIGYAEFDRPNRAYRGVIDDIRIYKCALSSSEISSLYHEDGWDK